MAVARRRLGIVEIAAVFALAGLFYASLYGELPYHDAARFESQVESGRPVFDMGHVLLQPAALLWRRVLGFGQAAADTQKQLNTVAAAAGVAILYGLLARLGCARWLAAVAAALAAASCGTVTLAPSAHFKLVALPFATGALAVLALAETSGRARRPAAAVLGGALLAVGAGFFAGVLATPPFAGLALLGAARREGASWGRAVLQAVLLGGSCAALFAALVLVIFALTAEGPLSAQGLAAALADKDALRPADHSLVNQAARAVFGTVNNFVAAPGLGAVIRAWLSGQVPSLRPYARPLLYVAIPWAATAAVLALTYLGAGVAALRGRRCLVPLAFLVGAQAWAVGYNLNDPEHWVNLTAPTLVLLATLFPPGLVSVGLPLWAAVTVAANLTLFAIPTATYPLHRYEAELRQQFTPRDLLIHFAAYPGRAYLGFFDLGGLRDLKLDVLYAQEPNRAAFFATLDQAIADTLRDGGRVVAFDLLDGTDWEAPWPVLAIHGLTKDALYSHLASRYVITREPGIAELKVWQLAAPPGT